MAMMVPNPAAVAMARWMFTPLRVMMRMAGVPPPIPSNEQKAPSEEPRPARRNPFGMFSSLAAFCARTGKMKCSPINRTPTPKMIFSARPSIKLVRMTPRMTPAMTDGSQPFRMFQSTAPRLACAWTERRDVNRIVASDVPIATCMMCDCEEPCPSNVSTAASAGTTTKPPPIPNMPATKPANRPAPSMDRIRRPYCSVVGVSQRLGWASAVAMSPRLTDDFLELGGNTAGATTSDRRRRPGKAIRRLGLHLSAPALIFSAQGCPSLNRDAQAGDGAVPDSDRDGATGAPDAQGERRPGSRPGTLRLRRSRGVRTNRSVCRSNSRR